MRSGRSKKRLRRLLRIDTNCAMEGVDVVALRKRVDDTTGERALLEMEERNLRATQLHLVAKHGLMLAPAVEDLQEPEQEVSDVLSKLTLRRPAREEKEDLEETCPCASWC